MGPERKPNNARDAVYRNNLTFLLADERQSVLRHRNTPEKVGLHYLSKHLEVSHV